MFTCLNIETAAHIEQFVKMLPTKAAFYETKSGTPRDARLQTVFNGNYRYKQAVVIADDPEDGSKKIAWEVIRQNDCAAMRAGYMPVAKYSYGYTSSGKMFFNNFTEAQLTLSVGQASGTIRDKLVAELIGKEFILVRNGVHPRLYVIKDLQTLKEVGTSTTVSLVDCKDWATKYTAQYNKEILAGTMPTPLVWYQCGITSTSTQRKGDLELFSLEYPLDERINKLTANGLIFLESVYGSEKLKAKEAIKLAARLSLPETNSINWGKLESLAVYAGKLDNNGVEFGDGTIIINESAFNRGAAEHGIDLTESAGTVIQCRSAFIKGCGQVVSPFAMTEILAANKGDGVIFIDVASPKDVLDAMIGIQKKTIKNKLVIFSKKNQHASEIFNVDMFVDLNALKAGFDLSLQPEISIMEIAHLHNGVNTSSQIVAGAMRSPVFMKIFLSIVKEAIDKKFQVPEMPNTIGISELGSDNFAEDLLWKIAPQFVKNVPAMMRSQRVKIVKSCLNKINKLNFEVKGWYLKGVCDNGCLFGIKLLRKNEVYAPGTKQDEGIVGELFRHPKMAEGEHARVKVVIKETLLKRIRNTPLSWMAKKALAEMISALAPGAIMLPSWDPELAAKLGGADYDGDGFDLIVDRRIVMAYKGIPEGAIHFGEDLPSDEEFTLSDNIANEAYAAAIHNGNHNVGQLVNFGYKMRAVKADVESGKLSQTVWSKFVFSKPWLAWKKEDKLDNISNGLSKNIGELFLPGKKAYQPLLTEMAKAGEKIDGEAVKNFGVRVYESDILNVDGLYAVLCDLEIAMASVVGRNIDAAKSGAKVFCPLFPLSRMFKSGIKAKLDIKKNENGEEQLVIPKSGIVKFGRSITYATEDPCFLLKVESAKYLFQKVNENY